MKTINVKGGLSLATSWNEGKVYQPVYTEHSKAPAPKGMATKEQTAA